VSRNCASTLSWLGASTITLPQLRITFEHRTSSTSMPRAFQSMSMPLKKRPELHQWQASTTGHFAKRTSVHNKMGCGGVTPGQLRPSVAAAGSAMSR